MKSIKTLSIQLIAGLSAISFVLSCHAGQSNPQKGPNAKEAVAASPASSVTADTAKPSVNANKKIIVYYFHGTMRCPTCYKLENYAKSEVEAGFADALAKGTMEWKSINVDVKGNEHFNDDYTLYTKSVIVSTVKDGKEISWKNLDKIWQLVHDEGSYRQYIRNEVKACLEGKCL